MPTGVKLYFCRDGTKSLCRASKCHASVICSLIVAVLWSERPSSSLMVWRAMWKSRHCSERICTKRLHLLQVIREQLLPCLDIATSGLLALVLRGLACGSAAFRSCSYEALALYKEALEQCNFR